MNGPLTELLEGVRRRLRVAWAVAWVHLAAPAVAAVALGFVLLGRLAPVWWPESAALAVVLGSGIVLLVASLGLRVPVPAAARAADRSLRTGDAFSSALEFAGSDPFSERVHRRAVSLAVGVRPREAVPLPRPPRRLWVAGGLALLGVGLALFPNPQDDVRRRQEAERALLEDEAERLRAEAAALERPEAGEQEQEVARRLEELARSLDSADGLPEGLEEIERARAELASGLPPGFLAAKAAVQGLDRSLETAPLPGASGADAAEQLEQAAAALEGLRAEELAVLAERLRGLAATQAVGDPAAAAALSAAAEAMEGGDLAGAAAALGEAASAQRTAAGSVRGGEARTAAEGAVRAAGERLVAGEQAGGQGEGQEQGAGQGQGQGEGQGQGQGDGQGQGAGQGQGSGGQGGAASGQVGGATPGDGSAAGQGGQGTPDGSGDNGGGAGAEAADEPQIYDPASTPGDELLVDAAATGGRTETVGLGNAPDRAAPSLVPVSDVLPRYEAEATQALDGLDIPPSLRSQVRDYFDRLAGREGDG